MNTHEMAVLIQLNHRNVVKLVGCCLETEIPIQVYEFVLSNGLLSERIRIHKSISGREILPWESRLRIASEIADAVTYIHTAAARPIIHRDIASHNIILDERFVPRLFAFELSLWIPLGETSVQTDCVRGTKGAMAPETWRTAIYTEKADVYDFGIILLEILAGMSYCEMLRTLDDIERRLDEMNSSSNSDNCNLQSTTLSVESRYGERVIQINLPEDYAISDEEGRRLILMANLFLEGRREQQTACLELSFRCTKDNPEERPMMEEVAKELRRIRKFKIANEVEHDKGDTSHV
ncbi:PREDICTED: wall-associated receptor kinase-like 1 [Nelumbo nucifera]|uniref:Protein kinase domain-containing protein n=2 Tax=Nelumbo nucifera TaxID=4432 RepID=A0A822Z3P0_NELNU|nr:PREDICTED: wall-associated receptor kinase-like 1 [Nelumbo nucifera]DAD39417.1 TPA_asm: hypothetical protein HUJ06_013740 [Nelumbo nucifera]